MWIETSIFCWRFWISRTRTTTSTIGPDLKGEAFRYLLRWRHRGQGTECFTHGKAVSDGAEMQHLSALSTDEPSPRANAQLLSHISIEVAPIGHFQGRSVVTHLPGYGLGGIIGIVEKE